MRTKRLNAKDDVAQCDEQIHYTNQDDTLGNNSDKQNQSVYYSVQH